MIIKTIEDESPVDHWGMLNVRNKIVLDLGCGRMWDIRPTTPEFFLNQGASKVIGVEMWDNERIWYKENVQDDRLTVFTDKVTTPEALRSLIQTHNPEVIKCDIEGDEAILMDFNSDDFKDIDEIAAEYHNVEMKSMFLDKYLFWGFRSVEMFALNGFDFEQQGVIYLKK